MSRGRISLTRPLAPDLRTQRAADAYARADRVVAETGQALELASQGLRVVLETEAPDEEALRRCGLDVEVLPCLHPAQEAAHLVGLGQVSPLVLVSQPVESWDELLETRATVLAAPGVASTEELAGCGVPSGHRFHQADGFLALSPEAGLAGWRDRLPLSGLQIVVTREESKARDLARDLADLGAAAVVFPVLRFDEPEDPQPLDRAIAELEVFDWVVFTSPNGVRFFFSRLRARGRDLRALGGCRLACIGPSTARTLAQHGLDADLVPSEFVAEGLLEAFVPWKLEGVRVLLPRAAEARDVLPETLRSRGALVEVVAAYVTRPPEHRTSAVQDADLVTFTSSSTARHFHELTQGLILPAAVIGPITGKTAEQLGYPVVARADRYTVEGLIDALVDWGRARKQPAP